MRARRAATAALLALAWTGLAVPRGSAAVEPHSGPPGASSSARPMLAYAGKKVVVLDEDGAVMSRVRRGYGGFSLDGTLLAKAYATDHGTRTAGIDATTGETLFRIRQTLLIPTVLRGGNAVAFSGRGPRDPYATSLWIRNQAGHERQLVQFSFGTGAPGVPTGMSEGYVMDYSFDTAADLGAVVAGNDYSDFRYDIWVVDDQGSHRLTKGQHSRYPAVSPSGGQVAYFREETTCGGPMPHYRGGDLLVVAPDGTGRRTLYDGGCDQYLDRPRWLDDDTVVAIQNTRRAGAHPEPLYDSRLVLVDVPSGQVSDPISVTDRVGDVSVSPALHRVAYTNWTQAKGFRVFHWTPGDGAPADPVAWVQGDTTQYDVGRVPHLRGDPTLIPSY